jgi:2-keto-4-pentenoate hydratase/2-oxohepta-3-ene-1,7-dioic acid hydratase in catechol pathway
MQAADQAISHPWFRSKSLDTFCPMGPWIALPDQVGNPGALDLELRVNGQVRQKANTRDLVFGIPQLIEFISRHMTLEPGDIISTGTPAGIAPIVPGDIVECEVEGIGILRNPVRAEA